MSEEQTPKTILLVEDDDFVGRAYKDGLRRAGFLVETAMDGNEAVKKAKSVLPDLIVLDLVMPLKNGFEVLEELRKDKAYSAIPIMVVSNLGQETDIEKAMQLGATDYLIKNQFSMKQMVERIQKYLGMQG
ncbi:MAG: two-component system, OmpR family, alkaline phosphatase synthesis response regulator PhoP [Parcubacteria group bacterium Gr01-1014_70]|nr:MAG: two-component system, OmpR family, alkaline phosphatase synthesis response regulator PhoP [Parcubacteria group bacterium Gr01-1014_70]